MEPAVVWTLTALLALLGFAGAVLPGIPGAPLIFAAALVNWLFLPGYVSPWTLIVLALLSVLTFAAEWGLSALGARFSGGGRWSLLGAPVGALCGLPFGLFGIVLGAVLGAAAAEAWFAGRNAKDALRAGVGAGLGVLAGTLGRVAIAVAMIAWLGADLLWN